MAQSSVIFLPQELQNDYENLLSNLADNTEFGKECLEFISKLNQEKVQPSKIRYLVLDLREQFSSVVDGTKFISNHLKTLTDMVENAAHDPDIISLLVDAHCLLADYRTKSGDVTQAEEHYLQALSLIPQWQSTKAVNALIFARLSHFNYQKGGIVDSENSYKTALDILEKCVESETIFLDDEIAAVERIQSLVAFATLSDLCRLQGLYGEMESVLKMALPIAEKHSEIEHSRILSWLVQATHTQEKEAEMLIYVLKAKDLMQKIKTNPAIMKGTTMRRLVRHHARISHTLFESDKKRSIEYDKEVFALTRAYLGNNLALVAQQAARLAFHCYKLYDDSGSHNGYKNMAEDILKKISQSEEKEFYFSMFGAEIKNVHFDLAATYQAEKLYEDAERHFKEGLEMAENNSSGPVRVFRWHKALGVLYHVWQKRENAIYHVQIALELSKNSPTHYAKLEKLLNDVKVGFEKPSNKFLPNRRNRRR